MTEPEFKDPSSSAGFAIRVAAITALWDGIAKGGASLGGAMVMANPDQLPEDVRPAANRFVDWLEKNPDLVDPSPEAMQAVIATLAREAPEDRTHWSELVAFALATLSMLQGLNFSFDASPEISAYYDERKADFQRGYLAAEKNAGYTDVSAKDLAAQAGIHAATVMIIRKDGVVPTKLAADLLARLFNLPDGNRFFSDERFYYPAEEM